MRITITASWALLLGMGMIMLGNGLQGSLLGMRASFEDFSMAATGLIMSCYYLGFLAGSTLTPRIVERVGHIRVFAALASLASTSVLFHAIFSEPSVWAAMRIVTGFSYAGLYVVAESWLNARATNENRGQLLAVYMIVVFGGLASGQLLLNVADPRGFELFILVSVLVSLALVPISLSNNPAPPFSVPAPLGVRQLYALSPLGFLAALATGMAHGAFFGMGAVYSVKAEMTLAQTSFFMGSVILGGVIFQWPVGWLSDRFDRRRVLAAISFLAAVTALTIIAVTNTAGVTFFLLAGLFGGLSLPMYSLCLSYINDHLQPEQMVAASSTIVLIIGIGSILGPLTVATLMSLGDSKGFFWYLAAVHGSLGVYALYRMARRTSVPPAEQHHYVSLPPRGSQVGVALVQESACQQTNAEPKAGRVTSTHDQQPGFDAVEVRGRP